MAKEITSFQGQLAAFVPFLGEQYRKAAKKEADFVTRQVLQGITWKRRKLFVTCMLTGYIIYDFAVNKTPTMGVTASAAGIVVGGLLIMMQTYKLSWEGHYFKNNINYSYHPNK